MRYAALLIALLTALAAPSAHAQAGHEGEEPPLSVNSATMIGIGKYNLLDTYLTPGAGGRTYTGPGIRVLNERMKMTRLADGRISRQQIVSVDAAKTENAAASATDIAGFIDYTLGYHYHLPQLLPELKLLAGGAVHGMGGFIYNTRNGNNPVAAKADVDLNISAMAIYRWRVKDYPITLRYQISLPFVGVMFSPRYGQSYYEIFDLGNSSGTVRLNAFHNKLAVRNYLTIDLPVSRFTIRAGYLHGFYRTRVNGLRTHIVSHSFMVGVVKEFVAFGGKKLRETHRFKSAYY